MLEGMVELKEFLVDDQVIKKNKLKCITEMILNLNELDNSDNLKDGRPSNELLTSLIKIPSLAVYSEYQKSILQLYFLAFQYK